MWSISKSKDEVNLTGGYNGQEKWTTHDGQFIPMYFLILKPGHSMRSLHPGLDNQYKLMLTLFIIGCLGVTETQWFR